MKFAFAIFVLATRASAKMSRLRRSNDNTPKKQALKGDEYFRDLEEETPLFSLSMSYAETKMSTGTESKKSQKRVKCNKDSLKRMPINRDDFGEPDWETIIELAFPPFSTPANGCPRLDQVGGSYEASYTMFPVPEAGKWNPCYYTKAFAGLDPMKGGYPTPLDTHYQYEFPAPFFGQPGDGSVHHCDGADGFNQDIGACPKLGQCPGTKDCATITDDYGIGHIPPFVPLAAVKNAYGTCGSKDICKNWFHFETSGCNIQKSVLDKLVYEYFGDGDTIKFQPPILLDGEPSSTYFRLEYGGEQPACTDGICRGPHYCSADVEGQPIWGDFCPYVHTGENSGKYRHPHLALAALELWIANQCMPDKCASEWLLSPNGEDYAADPKTSTSISWCEMKDEYDPISQPKVPYQWSTVGGIFPGLLDLYSGDCTSKDAPGKFVTEFARPTGVNCRG